MQKNSFYLINAFAVIAAFMLIITACEKDEDPPLFNLTISASPQQGGTVDGAGSYEEGANVNLSATPNEGYEFVNWTDGQDTEVSTSASFQFVMPGSDVSLTANFAELPPDKFTLTLEVNPADAGTVSGAGDYEEGETVTLSATPNEGYEFVNWTDAQDAEVSTEATFDYTMPGEDFTLTANFSEAIYSLTLEVNPADAGTVSGAGDYEEGETVTLSATPNEGYEFVNWTDAQDAEVSTNAAFDYTMPGEDVTLTANFSEVKYSLTLEVNPADAGTVSGAGEYGEGETASLSVSPVGEFEFVYWTDQDDNRVNTNATFDYFMPSDDMTLTANFVIQEITTGGGVTDNDGNEYETVIIGDQEWMAENLRVETYSDGTPIPTGLDDSDWENDNAGAYALYPHEDVEGIDSPAEMAETYGYLYNWHAVEHTSGLCPAGWRVPSHDDWLNLVSYLENEYGMHNELGMDPLKGAGNALKLRRQWGSPLGGEYDTQEHPRWGMHNIEFGFDMFGFSALPGGVRHQDGRFMSLGPHGYWWSSTEFNENYSHGRYFNSDRGNVNNTIGDVNSGYSVRCIKND